MKKYINPYLFFFVKDNELVVWNYKEHAQYQIEPRYLTRLLAIAQGDNSIDPIDEELLAAKLILTEKPTIEWGWDVLSQIFHIGTRDVALECDLQEGLVDYVRICKQSAAVGMPSLYTEKSGEKISLSAPDVSLLSKLDLWSVLEKRKTSRSFSAEPISVDVVSTLLYAVFGNIHPEWDDLTKHNLQQLGLRKSSPSAGGLHSCEAYLVALKVDGLNPGIYHYQSHSHVLTLIQEIDLTSQLGRLLGGQYFAANLSAGVFISARFEKTWHKYSHSRAYSLLYVDAGHLSQTFQLCVTALELQCWLTGILLDTEVANLLKIEGTTEYPLFFCGVGNGDGNSLSQDMQEYFSQFRTDP